MPDAKLIQCLVVDDEPPAREVLKHFITEEIFIVDLKLTLQKKSGVMDTILAANQPAYA